MIPPRAASVEGEHDPAAGGAPALGYKNGELKFLDLRARARAQLGDRFDNRRFHDAVRLTGPLPLAVLDRKIDAWIAAERAR